MPRPRIKRRVGFSPGVTYFKPAGVRVVELEEVVLTMDEFEAIRLKDLEGWEETKAAKQMGVSQPTFNRLVSLARKKIANALVNGKAIRVEGGNYQMIKPVRPGFGRRFRGGMR